MNKKVIVVLAIFLLTLASFAHAQKQAAIPRVGILRAGSPGDVNLELFLQGLRELGYVEGKNILIEVRYAEGNQKRSAELAKDLVQLNVDAVFTSMVASLARPGGNVTGMSLLASDLWPKRLELLKEMFPTITRAAMLWNKSNAGMAIEAKATLEVAGPLGVTLQDRGVQDPSELETVFVAVSKDRPDALLALIDLSLSSHRERILEFLASNRIPAIFENKEWVEAGGLISYGPSYSDVFRRAAVQMDKILKGTKPANIPVEQPTKFEMVINLKTAKQIGLTIPPNVLARADKVIR